MDEKTAARVTPVGVTRGLWGTLRWRAQNIFWNYMGLQAQLGLYGSPEQSGDP